MNFDEYEEGVLRTANQNNTREQNILNAALGLGEVGEVQNIIKKELFHGHKREPFLVLDELGDALYYVTWTANLYGFSLEQVAEFNNHKLKKRYPNGFESERSIQRTT